MAHDVDLSVGANTSAVAGGLGELRNMGARARHELEGEFAKAIAVTGIIAGIEAVLQKAEQIHHQAERFNVDAQQLQLIANAARQDEIAMDGIARSMNRLGIVTPQTAEHLAALNINFSEWQRMSLGERFLSVADAVHKLGNNTETFNAVAGLLGARFGTDLLPLLQRGREEIERLGNATVLMSDKTLESIDSANDAWEKFKTDMEGRFAPVVAFAINGLTTSFVLLTSAAQICADTTVLGFQAMAAAAKGNFSDAKGFLDSLRQSLADIRAEENRQLDQIGKVHPQSHAGAAGGEEDGGADSSAGIGFGDTAGTSRAGGGGGSGAGGGGSGGGSTGSGGGSGAIDQLAAKQRQFDLDHLNNEDKLFNLELERQTIQDNLNTGIENQILSQEEQAALEIKLLENAQEREQVQEEIDTQWQKITKDISLARDAAESEAEQAERSNILQQMRSKGATEHASALERVWEIQDKINDALDTANDYWERAVRLEEQGESALAQQARDVAQMNEDLSARLETEEAITRQLEARAASEARIKAGHPLLGVDESFGAGAGFTEAAFNDPRVVSLLNAGFKIDEHAITASTDARTGIVDMDRLVQEIIAATQRGTKDIGFIQRAQDTAKNAQIYQAQVSQEKAAQQSQLDTMQKIINEIALFGSSGSPGGIFGQMLAELMAISQKLSSVPGQH